MELLDFGCSRLELEIASFQVTTKCVPRCGSLECLLSRRMKFETRFFENRAEGNVRLRQFVSNLVENLHRIRSSKREIRLLHPTDDIGSSLNVSPIEHVVPLLLGKEVLDFDGSSVGPPGPCDREIFADSGKHALPVAEELVVQDDGPWATARVLLGLDRVPQPQEERLRGREPVACSQGSRHLEGVSHSESDGRRDLELCQNCKPEREQTRDPRVLHDEQRRGAVLLMQQECQLLAQLPCCGRYERSVRECRHLVPGRTDAPQEGVVRVDNLLRLPEPKVVAITRRHDVLG